MLIRGAIVADIQAIIEMGKRGHLLGRNADKHFNEARAELFLNWCLKTNDRVVYVAERHSKLVGVLIGAIYQHGFVDVTYASDIVTYSERAGAGRGLIKAFVTWGFVNGADKIILSTTFGTEPRALYERIGFERIGGVYTLRS